MLYSSAWQKSQWTKSAHLEPIFPYFYKNCCPLPVSDCFFLDCLYWQFVILRSPALGQWRRLPQIGQWVSVLSCFNKNLYAANLSINYLVWYQKSCHISLIDISHGSGNFHHQTFPLCHQNSVFNVLNGTIQHVCA